MGYKLSNRGKGTLYSLFAGFTWGFIGYFGLNVAAVQSVVGMLFWRFFMASVMMIFVLIWKRGFKVPKVDWQAALIVFCLGLSFYSTSTYLYFVGSDYVGTGLAMVIFFAFPIFVIFIHWAISRQKVKIVYYVASSVMLCGLIVLADPSNLGFDSFGIIPCLISSVAYALYIVISKNLMSRLPPIESTLMVVLGNTVAFGIVGLYLNQIAIPSTPDQWLDVFGLSIICTALPILLVLESLKYISASRSSLLTVLEPVTVLVVGVLLLNETLTLLQVFGTLLILSSAIIIQIDWQSIFLKNKR